MLLILVMLRNNNITISYFIAIDASDAIDAIDVLLIASLGGGSFVSWLVATWTSRQKKALF